MSLDVPKGSLVEPGQSGLLYGTTSFMTFLKLVVAGINMPTALSGTTADRPTRYVSVGTQYYDTTLGKPIWVHQISPIVWHDANGAVV